MNRVSNDVIRPRLNHLYNMYWHETLVYKKCTARVTFGWLQFGFVDWFAFMVYNVDLYLFYISFYGGSSVPTFFG
jgi:hypothetical protein